MSYHDTNSNEHLVYPPTSYVQTSQPYTSETVKIAQDQRIGVQNSPGRFYIGSNPLRKKKYQDDRTLETSSSHLKDNSFQSDSQLIHPKQAGHQMAVNYGHQYNSVAKLD